MNFLNLKREAPAPAISPVKSRRRRLFRKYIAFFVTVVCLALLLEDLLQSRFLIRDYTGQAVRLQQAQAHAAASRIDEFIKGIEGQIGWTTQLPWAAATLDEWRLDAARLFKQVPAITEYIKIDASGRKQLHVSRLGPEIIGSESDFSQDPRFTLATANKVYHGPVNFRRGSEPYITISVSGLGNDVSLVEVNLKFIWEVLSQIKAADGGKAYVVDDKGRLIAHPDLSLVLRNTDGLQLRQVRIARTGEPLVAPEDERAVEDFEGRKVLAASATIPTLNWLLLVEVPVDEAFAPLRATLLRSGLVLMAALIIAILAGLLLARKMVVPIEALRAGAQRLGNGDLAQRIAIKTEDELEELADQFNQMATRLQQAHENLQMKVEQRTAELTTSNRRLASAAERLRRTNEFKSEILGTMAHDLKNPLQLILGRAEIMEVMIDRTPFLRENVVKQIDSIRDAVTQLVGMINSLLTDAMTDAHEISIRHTAVDIPALIDEVADANRPLADKKGQMFTVTSPGNLTVTGDHDRLREAIDNLVSNAIKYTPPAGHIDLTVTHERSCAVIRVADNGPGLTDDDMTRLFGRFQRLSARPTGGESSTGLGLSIVKRIVELHGGSVVGTSCSAGRGATFVISLPLASDCPFVERDVREQALCE